MTDMTGVGPPPTGYLSTWEGINHYTVYAFYYSLTSVGTNEINCGSNMESRMETRQK
jgi:hypothetical protein